MPTALRGSEEGRGAQQKEAVDAYAIIASFTEKHPLRISKAAAIAQ